MTRVNTRYLTRLVQKFEDEAKNPIDLSSEHKIKRRLSYPLGKKKAEMIIKSVKKLNDHDKNIRLANEIKKLTS